MKNILILIFALSITACATKEGKKSNPFNPIHVKENLKRGVTTKKEVVKAFGAPNILTEDKDGETWTYQKENSSSKENELTTGLISFLPIPIAPTLAGVINESTNSTTSSNSYNLYVDFNRKGVVKDYSVRRTAF